MGDGTWEKVELSWRIRGGTDRELADLLTEAGVMDAVTNEQLTDAFSKGFDIRSLIWAGGERLVFFARKSRGELEHFKLFQNLLLAARPALAVENLKETVNANPLREPKVSGPNGATGLGAVCTLSFQYQGKAFSFEVHPQGHWQDVASVMKGFDSFMKAIGRDDRCYVLEWFDGGEFVLLVVAPASKFEPVAKSLGLPIEPASEREQDAVTAYQRDTGTPITRQPKPKSYMEGFLGVKIGRDKSKLIGTGEGENPEKVRFVSFEAGQDPGEEFRKATKSKTAPLPSRGGVVQHDNITMPDGTHFYGLTFHGDLIGWQRLIEQAAAEQGLITAKIDGERLLLSDGRSFLVSDCSLHYR